MLKTTKARDLRTKRKPAASTRAAAPTETAASPSSSSKLDQVIAALRAPAGVSIPDLVDLTGWQEKSVRGFISGALKKKRQLNVTSGKIDGVRLYRIEEPQA